jgi:hypothetical protein
MMEPTFSSLSGNPADRALADRVLASVPVSQPAFSKLLSLLDIRASDTVDTACVTLGGRSRLLLNPHFVDSRCRTDETLAMLVMHELFHVLLGHTRLFERITPAQNFAFDAVINAQLCLLFPAPASTALFRDLYAADRLPWALLRPPDGWGGHAPQWVLKGQAGRIHRSLYTDASVTYGELFGLLERLFQEAGAVAGSKGKLLGSHREGKTAGSGPDPEVTREIREIIARWPMLDRGSGRDDGGELTRKRLRLARARREAVGAIRRALWPLLDLADGVSTTPRRAWIDMRISLPFRSGADRRAELKALLGEEPLFFQGRASAPGLERHRRAHVYVDVSGSMAEELALIYGALLPLLDCLHPRIHLFSTRVEDVGPAELKRGEVASAWGTDIVCVTTHLLERRVRRALIITDGWVGQVPDEHRVRLARRGVRVNSLVSADGDAEFAFAFKGRVFRMPELT